MTHVDKLLATVRDEEIDCTQDSNELKRLIEASTKEIKAVGMVSASTGLEMVAHMRRLEALLRRK